MGRLRGWRRRTRREHSLLVQKCLDRVQPPLVVNGLQVGGGLHALDHVAKLIEVVVTADSFGEDRANLALPLGVKDRFVGLDDDRAEPVHPAHVVDAVHDKRV